MPPFRGSQPPTPPKVRGTRPPIPHQSQGPLSLVCKSGPREVSRHSGRAACSERGAGSEPVGQALQPTGAGVQSFGHCPLIPGDILARSNTSMFDVKCTSQ